MTTHETAEKKVQESFSVSRVSKNQKYTTISLAIFLQNEQLLDAADYKRERKAENDKPEKTAWKAPTFDDVQLLERPVEDMQHVFNTGRVHGEWYTQKAPVNSQVSAVRKRTVRFSTSAKSTLQEKTPDPAPVSKKKLQHQKIKKLFPNLKLTTPPQGAGYEVSSLSSAPQAAGNMTQRDLNVSTSVTSISRMPTGGDDHSTGNKEVTAAPLDNLDTQVEAMEGLASLNINKSCATTASLLEHSPKKDSNQGKLTEIPSESSAVVKNETERVNAHQSTARSVEFIPDRPRKRYCTEPMTGMRTSLIIWKRYIEGHLSCRSATELVALLHNFNRNAQKLLESNSEMDFEITLLKFCLNCYVSMNSLAMNLSEDQQELVWSEIRNTNQSFISQIADQVHRERAAMALLIFDCYFGVNNKLKITHPHSKRITVLTITNPRESQFMAQHDKHYIKASHTTSREKSKNILTLAFCNKKSSKNISPEQVQRVTCMLNAMQSYDLLFRLMRIQVERGVFCMDSKGMTDTSHMTESGQPLYPFFHEMLSGIDNPGELQLLAKTVDTVWRETGLNFSSAPKTMLPELELKHLRCVVLQWVAASYLLNKRLLLFLKQRSATAEDYLIYDIHQGVAMFIEYNPVPQEVMLPLLQSDLKPLSDRPGKDYDWLEIAVERLIYCRRFYQVTTFDDT